MADFVEAAEMDNYRDMLEELFAVESDLSNWEIDFLDSLNDWDGCFTESQAETLQNVYDKVL